MVDHTMPEGSVWLTAKIKEELQKIAENDDVAEEAIVNVALRLIFSDSRERKKIINLIKSAELGGQVDLTNKGW